MSQSALARVERDRPRVRSQEVVGMGELVAHIRTLSINAEDKALIIRSLMTYATEFVDLAAMTVEAVRGNRAFREQYDPAIRRFFRLADGFAKDRKTTKEVQAHCREEGRRDPDTHLLRKDAFRAEVEDFLATDVESRGCAVGFIDLGKFGLVNKQWGQEAGDRVIEKVAEILRENIRSSDRFVARLGGDEFAFFLPSVDKNSATLIGKRLQQVVSDYDWPSTWPGLPSQVVRADIGITCYPLGPVTERVAQVQKTSKGLLSRADELMRRCKQLQTPVEVDVLHRVPS